MVATVVALVLAVVIFTKVDKKGWCNGEKYSMSSKMNPKSKGMILKSATYACGYLGESLDPDQDYGDVYPCGKWAKENKENNGLCTVGNTQQPCLQQGDDSMYGPLGCCEAICGDSSYMTDETVQCADPRA
jgi:hypothetical protein